MRGTVVAWVPPGGPAPAEHERMSLAGFAQRIARLIGYGLPGPDASPQGHRFIVPLGTLTCDEARSLGVAGLQDLFGGVVEHPYMGTKAIAHSLVRPGTHAPPGWSDEFPHAVRDVVLPGFTAFDPADALEAGGRLLQRGPVRIKPVMASGGAGQGVVRDAAGLRSAVEALERRGVIAEGVVLEENLEELQTFSVGWIRVGPHEATYFGTQRQTRNHHGASVFGGSDLVVARGGFPDLLGLNPGPAVQRAVEQAARFDEAAAHWLPGLLATRRNYDVLLGRDAAGQERCAVLEQSWRVGGATGPEIAALEAFQAQPERRFARTSCFEVYADAPEPPPGATVYYDACDPHAGRLLKYTVIHPDDDAQ